MPDWVALINWPRLFRNITIAVFAQVAAEVIKVRREIGLA